MTREETLAQLQELQRRVRRLRAETGSPALERTMQLLEMYCHMARWELGEFTTMVPEEETLSESRPPDAAARAEPL